MVALIVPVRILPLNMMLYKDLLDSAIPLRSQREINVHGIPNELATPNLYMKFPLL